MENKVIALNPSSAEELLDQIELAQTKLLPEIKQANEQLSMFAVAIKQGIQELALASEDIKKIKADENHLTVQLDVLKNDFTHTLEALGKNINANETLKHDIDESISRIRQLEGIDVEFVKTAMEVAAENMRKTIIRSVKETVSEAKTQTAYIAGGLFTAFTVGVLCGVMLMRIMN